MSAFQAEPFELCPAGHEDFSPLLDGCFNTWKNCFLVNELDCQLAWIDLSPLDQAQDYLRKSETVFPAREGHIYRQAVGKHVADPYLCRLHDIHTPRPAL